MQSLILLAALTLAAPSGGAAAPPVEIDRIIAVVDDDVITLTELNQRVEEIALRLRKSNTPAPPMPVLRRQVLERLIVERIQLAQAQSLGIRVDDEALNQVVARIAQENGLTLLQFREVLQKDGYDFATFRDQLRNEMRINQLQARQVESRVSVSPQEVDNYLSSMAVDSGMEYHLFHILVAVPEAAGPEQVRSAREKAQRLRGELRSGADFKQTAVAYSDGQQALDGGDLGWRKGAQLPTLFGEIVEKMKKGEISDPIRSPSGYHILMLADKRGEEKHVIKQTRVRHILIRPNALLSDFEAKKRLERLRTRLLSGEDFVTLARANSEDPGSAAKGGDLGWSNPGQFVPPFEKAMNALSVNEISQPVQTQFGWHLIQVLERRNYDNTEEYRRVQAHETLRRRKLDEALQQWLRQLRDEAYVEYRLEE